MAEQFPVVIPGLIVTIFILLLAVFLIFAVFSHYRKHAWYVKHMEEVIAVYEKNIADTQATTREQTFAEISNEIYHNVSLSLTLCRFSLYTLSKEAGPDFSEKMALSVQLIRHTIARLSGISKTLDARLICVNGIEEAIQKELACIDRAGLFTIEFRSEGDACTIDDHSQICIFRIFREALQNIISHSGAASITINIVYGTELTFTIRDNGVGFECNQEHLHGSGIAFMKNYAAEAHGQLAIDSAPNQGTLISLRLPVHSINPNGKRKYDYKNSTG